jgi:hypothetical protein
LPANSFSILVIHTFGSHSFHPTFAEELPAQHVSKPKPEIMEKHQNVAAKEEIVEQASAL